MPEPSGFNDLFNRGKPGFPAKLFDGLLRPGKQSRWIASPAGFLDGGDGFAADTFAGIDHFAYGLSLAIAEVEEPAFTRFHREHVCLGQIDDMNVIANAGAVRGGVIGAKDFAFAGLPKRDLKDIRDKVSLDAMMFTEFFACASGIEVAQRDKLQPVNLLIPA